MGLPGRVEIRIHAQMESKCAALKPRTTSSHQIRGLDLLNQAKHARLERARGRFLARRHGKLDVIETDDFTHSSILRQ